MVSEIQVAVVGATGVVGGKMVEILEERRVPVGELRPIASDNSSAKSVKFCGENIPLQSLTKDSFNGIDFALFSAGSAVSLKYAPIAVQSGAVVIDNSAAFRMDPKVPLVVPEVNRTALLTPQKRKSTAKTQKTFAPLRVSASSRCPRIIANPNCSTIQLVCVLKPIHDAARIRRVVVSTYQSVSGAGREAMEELKNSVEVFKCRSAEVQRTGNLNTQTLKHSKTIFPHPIAFNCIPHIDDFLTNGYTKEEMKVINETKKIMGDDSIKVTCTAVRVPVWVGHSESVNIETLIKLTAGDVRGILRKTPGVEVIDEPEKSKYPLAIEAAGRDEVFVGRIREDYSVKNGIALWIVADNVRKGAALNAVQILECLLEA